MCRDTRQMLFIVHITVDNLHTLATQHRMHAWATANKRYHLSVSVSAGHPSRERLECWMLSCLIISKPNVFSRQAKLKPNCLTLPKHFCNCYFVNVLLQLVHIPEYSVALFDVRPFNVLIWSKRSRDSFFTQR